jgi:hypothetical protein
VSALAVGERNDACVSAFGNGYALFAKVIVLVGEGSTQLMKHRVP